jgi:CHAD domain-containing protein/CYTH domain-containing protein
MPETATPLLYLPACRVARHLGLARMEEWGRARTRLDDPADAEALHDFRVALRRLRSVIRAFRSVCEDLVPRRLRRRLRRLADATGAGRDLEVQRAWLLDRLTKLAPRQRSHARWMAAGLEARATVANQRLRQQVAKRYAPLHEDLWATLASQASAEVADEAGASISAGAVVGKALAEWTGDLEYRLGTIHAITDDPQAHAARILVKRLRYLLEPFRSELAGAPAAIDRLKQLQDLLGDLHDLHRIASELRVVFRDAAVHRADDTYHEALPWGAAVTEPPEPKLPGVTGGLTALARILRAEGEALFALLKDEWLDGGAAGALCADLRAFGVVAQGLRAPGVEIERKFLLSALPPHVADFPSEEIEQGWLPGQELVERLRHVRSGEGEAWYRTVKSGQAIRRIEIEEATSQELFEALWPLTEGCRVRKRRYRIPNGMSGWEVDQFLDRELVLAEVEVPAADTAIELPAWLTECLVREVTSEPAYVNRTLAR